MTLKPNYKYLLLCFVLLLGACAQITSPLGGPKDESAPVLVQEESEPNLQTNFTKKEIVLTFNEWIKVSNPVKEIIVSPPTDYLPKVTEKGRSVIFEFSDKEVLKENTTYQINYGDAIRDFTEGNVYKNLIFIFSTGDVIDSLTVSGTVVNTLTKEPQTDVIVSLYDNLNDTAFVKSKPLYFTKTNKDGQFKLNNLRSDTFQLFALVDKNVNYYYDLPDEEIAFIDSTIFVSDKDSLSFKLSLFNEEDIPRMVQSKQDQNGLIKIMYSPKPKDLEIRNLDSNSTFLYFENNKDTIYLWHNDLESDSINFEISNVLFKDTITTKPSKKSLQGVDLKFDTGLRSDILVHKGDSINILFQNPLSSFTLDSISVYDTTQVYKISNSKIENRSLILYVDSLKDITSYNLDILPNALTDIFNNTNADTLQRKITTFNPSNFGIIELDVIAAVDSQYIIKLMNKTNVIDTFMINGSRKIKIDRIEKGQYNLEIIEDSNKNNYWSSGNLALKKHPERIKEITLEELKAGWDLNLTVDIKAIFNGTKID